MKKLFRLFLCLLLCVIITSRLSAKTSAADSMLRKLQAIKDRTLRMQAFYDTCTIKYGNDPKAAGVLATAFFKENKDNPVDSNTAKANYLLGDVAMLNGHYDVSLKYLLTGLKLAEQDKMYRLQCEILSDISGVYMRTEDMEKSIKAVEDALLIARVHNIPAKEASLMDHLAVRHAILMHYDQAYLLYDAALLKARLLNLPVLMEIILENKAATYSKAEKYEWALVSLKAATKIADSLQQKNTKILLILQQSHLYMKMNRLREAESLAHVVFAHRSAITDPDFAITVYSTLNDISRRKGDFKSALAYTDSIYAIQNVIYSKEKMAQMEELQARYDTEVKDKKLSVQDLQIRSDKKLNLVLWCTSGLLLLIGVLIFRNQRKTRKLYWQIFVQSKELERANQVKDRLFSTISHDMRRPVNSLLSFTMLLDEGNMPPEKLAIYAAELKTSLSFTATLMENLLNFARSQMQGYHPNLEKISLVTVTNEALDVAAPAAQQKNITFINEVNNKDAVIADVDMLGLIIRNLLGNAIKFTNEGGIIVLSSAVVPDGTVCWQVQDNGIGIESALVTTFNQHKDSSEQPLESTLGTDKEKGTGLGLMLSKTFLALMGGHITLQSEKDKGSTFRVYLLSAKSDSAV